MGFRDADGTIACDDDGLLVSSGYVYISPPLWMCKGGENHALLFSTYFAPECKPRCIFYLMIMKIDPLREFV